MPPVFAVIAKFFTITITVQAGSAALGFLKVLAAISQVAIGIGISAGVNRIFGSRQNLGDFAQRATNQTVSITSPTLAHRYIQGEVLIGGLIAYVDTLPGDILTPPTPVFELENAVLAVVYTLCRGGDDRHVEEIGTVYLGDYPIYESMIDQGTRWVNSGRYRDHVRIVKYVGDGVVGSQPFSQLETDSELWTGNHVQEGYAKCLLEMVFNPVIFPNGLPNASFRVKGTRTEVSGTEFSFNSIRGLEFYLKITHLNGGLNIQSSEIPSANWTAEANVCDEFVVVNPEPPAVCDQDSDPSIYPKVYPDTDEVLVFTSAAAAQPGARRVPIQMQTGDQVQLENLSAGGVLPTGLALATDYYLIVVDETGAESDGKNLIPGSSPASYSNRDFLPRIAFATTYRNAVTDTRVNITAIGNGSFEISKKAEPRYTSNYVIDFSRQPVEIIRELLQSCAGSLYYINGEYVVKAGAWVTPTVTLDEDDTLSPIEVKTAPSRRERYNRLTGFFLNPSYFDQPVTYAPVVSGLGFGEEGSIWIDGQLDLAGTSRHQQAQRVAQIALEKHRQRIWFKTDFTLAALQLKPGDTFNYINDRLGWDGTGKEFEVMEMEFSIANDPDNPVPAIAMTCQETASELYDWNLGTASIIDPAPNTNLPNPAVIRPPIDPTVTEAISQPTGREPIPKATIVWESSADPFAVNYEIETKLSTDTAWDSLGLVGSQVFRKEWYDYAAGLYDVRVRTVATLGRTSDWAQTQIQLAALTAIPGDVQNFICSVNTDGIATATWDLPIQPADADVFYGGAVRLKHDSDTGSGDWTTSINAFDPGFVPGALNLVQFPALDGHLLAKFQDRSGGLSLNAASCPVLQESQFNWVVNTTLTEDATFLGTKVDMVLDTTFLRLSDDGSDVSLTGSYAFNNAADLGARITVRLTRLIDVTIVQHFADLFDAGHGGNFDSAELFDSLDGGEANARVEIRTSPDDPTGTPTWSGWRRLDTEIGDFWGIEARLIASTGNDQINIRIHTLRVIIEQRLLF